MQKGFMYLTAIIDVYSRYIVGWGLSNSLDATESLSVVKKAVNTYGAPEIIKSDQGGTVLLQTIYRICKGRRYSYLDEW